MVLVPIMGPLWSPYGPRTIPLWSHRMDTLPIMGIDMGRMEANTLSVAVPCIPLIALQKGIPHAANNRIHAGWVSAQDGLASAQDLLPTCSIMDQEVARRWYPDGTTMVSE